jgi:hypothetical protein
MGMCPVFPGAVDFGGANMRNECDGESPRFLRLSCWLIGLKCCLCGLLLILMIAAGPAPQQGGPSWTISWSSLAGHLAAWDAGHYLLLAQSGYHKGDLACAFYPLWPMLIKWGSVFTGGNYITAGVILANSFSLVAWLLFYTIVRSRWGDVRAKWAVAFLVAFPGAFFYQLAYTESLFFLLLMLLWLALERKCHLLACVAACLLPSCRAIGLLCLVPILWHLDTASRARNWCRLRPNVSGNMAFALLLSPVCGWFLYLGVMKYWTGDAFEGFRAQARWPYHRIENLWNVPGFVVSLLNAYQWHGGRGSLVDRLAFLTMLSCLPIMWKADKGLVLWIYVLVVVPAMSGMFVSFIRYEAPAFPMFIALALTFAKPGRAVFGFAVLGLFGCVQVMLAWRYASFLWAG